MAPPEPPTAPDPAAPAPATSSTTVPAPAPTTRAESVAAGLAARSRRPLAALADLDLARDRDPVGLLLRQDETRVPELVPVRHERMLASPFTFYRGAALPMADDLATASSSGLTVQLCGDAHLSNFGIFGSPERRLVFDLNDFDETLPGPFEWDLARLVASTVVASRENGLSRAKCRRVALATAKAYREAMVRFAGEPVLAVWYAHLDVDDMLAELRSGGTREGARKVVRKVAKARRRDGVQALAKLTEVVDGRRRIVPDPPLVVPVEDLSSLDADTLTAQLRALLDGYARTLPPERRWLVGQFTLTQVARKVVGVGSVGTRAWILLLEPHDGLDPLLLQAKEANRSVLADYLGESAYSDQGERVVVGQRLMQAVGDVLLGWQPSDGSAGQRAAHYYVRQLRDWKYGIEIGDLDRTALTTYVRACAWTLARAHARTGDRIAIAAYLGDGPEADEALADLAEAYADQTERDHAAFAAAVAAGRVATPGRLGRSPQPPSSP